MLKEQGPIIDRLERLERQNRRMKLTGLATLVVVGAFLLMGQASLSGTLSEVRARRFVLQDSRGRERAALDINSGAPGLVLLDANGKPRAVLAVLSDGPWLQMSDASGFETDIGGTITATGKACAASIVLFGRDKSVLWSAPPQN